MAEFKITSSTSATLEEQQNHSKFARVIKLKTQFETKLGKHTSTKGDQTEHRHRN